MTIDPRLDRLSHFTAGLDDQARRDREESRQLWREAQEEILTFSRKLNDLADQFLRFQKEAEERDRKTGERFRETDTRPDLSLGNWRVDSQREVVAKHGSHFYST